MASVTTATPMESQHPSNNYQQGQGSGLYGSGEQQINQSSHQMPIQQENDASPNNIPRFQPYLDQTPSPSVDINQNASNYPYDAYVGQPTSDDISSTTFATPESPLSSRGINMKYQLFLDQITPHWKARWAFSLTALFIFMARVVLAQGWYVVCYGLAIYYLNLFIGFISPKIDPSLNLIEDEDGPMLPTHANDEFKPFVRRLPEFKFWLSATEATLVSLFLTMFEIFDIPVFWPILLLYFIILTACTLRQQIRHMIRWKYVPWDAGKKQYTGKNSGSSDFDPTTV